MDDSSRKFEDIAHQMWDDAITAQLRALGVMSSHEKRRDVIERRVLRNASFAQLIEAAEAGLLSPEAMIDRLVSASMDGICLKSMEERDALLLHVAFVFPRASNIDIVHEEILRRGFKSVRKLAVFAVLENVDYDRLRHLVDDVAFYQDLNEVTRGAARLMISKAMSLAVATKGPIR